MRLDLKVPEVSLSMWTLAGYLRRFRALLRKGAINFLSNFVPVAFPGVIGPRGEVINRKWKMGGGDLASENVVPPPALPLPPHPVLGYSKGLKMLLLHRLLCRVLPFTPSLSWG